MGFHPGTQIMKQIARLFYTFRSQLIHFVGIPVFAFIFVSVYDPLGIRALLDMGSGLTDFNMTIVTIICFGCLAITRMLMYFLKDKLKLSYPLYISWCVLEIVLCSMFTALFLCLMGHKQTPYFGVLGKTLLDIALIYVFPYLIIDGYTIAYDVANSDPEESDESLIRFRDMNENLKLTIAAEAILYIEASENYVKIWYLAGDKIKSYLLRSSMKRLEALLERHAIIRCQRAYFINPNHIKILRRDTDGFIFADLDRSGCPPIPVSKTYYEALSAKL